MSRPVTLPLLLALALVALAPAAAAADEAAPVTRATAIAPTPARGVPAARAERAPRTAEEKALRAVEEDGRTRVESLVKSMQGLQDGPALRALQHKVEEVKQAQEVQFLQVKARFARERGDLATAQEAQRLIDLILNPPKPVAAPALRQQPEKQLPEGGRP
jgi:Skp family chaperone for outer membrane proteins